MKPSVPAPFRTSHKGTVHATQGQESPFTPSHPSKASAGLHCRSPPSPPILTPGRVFSVGRGLDTENRFAECDVGTALQNQRKAAEAVCASAPADRACARLLRSRASNRLRDGPELTNQDASGGSRGCPQGGVIYVAAPTPSLNKAVETTSSRLGDGNTDGLSI